MWDYTRMIDWFNEAEAGALLQQGTWGIEREAQRVTKSGDLALSDHPAEFGNKLTHPRITTDFSESQLELITPPHRSIQAAYAELADIHDEVEAALRDELLWPLSMPPRLPSEELIPIARYDDSPEGRANEAYRHSLAQRYGKKMQMISGLHVNFSFQPELLKYIAGKAGIPGDMDGFRDQAYFAMARNFLRYRWFLVYLFGASPVVDSSYNSVVSNELSIIERCCPACCPTIGRYEKYATSLRVSRYGYSNTNQQELMVSFDSLAAHIASFRSLLQTVLKKESEFYSSIRLKPEMAKGESYLEALEKRGVHYAEVRLLDLNPFVREGVSIEQLRMLHLFLLWCLFEKSPPVSSDECAWMNENHHLVSLFGRKPKLKLRHYTQGRIEMKVWMERIIAKLKQIALLLDDVNGGSDYRSVIEEESMKVQNIERIPSARMMAEMKDTDESFIAYGVRLAEFNKHKSTVGCAHE